MMIEAIRDGCISYAVSSKHIVCLKLYDFPTSYRKEYRVVAIVDGEKEPAVFYEGSSKDDAEKIYDHIIFLCNTGR